MKILIVEDNFRLRENLVSFFKHSNILAEESWNWQDALEKMNRYRYDVVILDVNMPIMNWKDFLKTLRKSWNWTPVLALTSNSMLQDKVEMFELWVDDYLTKPFELQELLLRVKAIFKRHETLVDQEVSIWEISIDMNRRKVYKKWVEVPLTNKEYMVVLFLAENRWIPKNKTEILEYVWGAKEESLEMSSITLEAHISNIRRKLWKNLIKTIKQVWYVIDQTS